MLLAPPVARVFDRITEAATNTVQEAIDAPSTQTGS